MIHYGHEPPWQGRSFHYGSWRRGEELWDGSGYAWTWVPPAATMLGFVGGILADYYVPVLQRELNRELSILTEFRVEQGTQLPRSAAAEAAL